MLLADGGRRVLEDASGVLFLLPGRLLADIVGIDFRKTTEDRNVMIKGGSRKKAAHRERMWAA